MIGLEENNPFMGFRAIRFCLKHKEIFKVQLRALLRASAQGDLKIIYPMISGLAELLEANLLLEEAKEELRQKEQAFDEHVEVGTMIEVPSAVQVAADLAHHSDFFSIGTNDLTQYMLAVDRVNDEVAHLYNPAHPAVVRSMKIVIDAANVAKIPVGICGEIAGESIYTPLLLGLGLRELSVTPVTLPEIRYIVRRMDVGDMERLAKQVLECSDPDRIQNILQDFLTEKIEPHIKEALAKLKAGE